MESESSHQYCWCRNALLTYSGNFAYWISQSSPSYCSFGASKLFKVYSLLTLYFIVVYDVTKRESFSNLADVWTQEIEANSTNKDCIKMLVGNKVDKVPSLLETWLLFAFLERLWSDLRISRPVVATQVVVSKHSLLFFIPFYPLTFIVLESKTNGLYMGE